MSETDPLFPVKEHGKWGYMDKSGKLVISPDYYDAYPFTEGLALVQPHVDMDSRAIRVRFIDTSGNLLGSKTYAYAEVFSDGLALVVIAGEEKWGPGYIDKTGEMVIPQNQYKYAKSFTPVGIPAILPIGT
jgi:WG containing repeat